MSQAESTKQNSNSEEVNNGKDVRLWVIKNKKIITTITNTISMSKKLSTTSTKLILLEDG